MTTFSVDGSNRDAENAVGITVKVAVVIAGRAIATGEDVNISQAVATVLDSVLHGALDQDAGCFHRPAIIRGSP